MKEILKINIPILEMSRRLKILPFTPMNITWVRFAKMSIFHKIHIFLL